MTTEGLWEHESEPSVLCMSQVVESRGERPSARYAHVAMQYDQGTRMAILGGADGKGARLTDLYTVVSLGTSMRIPHRRMPIV